jgi:hypothetical protein
VLSFPDFTDNSIISNLDLIWWWRLRSVCWEACKMWTHCFSPPPVHNTNPMKTSLDNQAKFSNTLWNQVHICHSCHTHTHLLGLLFRALVSHIILSIRPQVEEQVPLMVLGLWWPNEPFDISSTWTIGISVSIITGINNPGDAVTSIESSPAAIKLTTPYWCQEETLWSNTLACTWSLCTYVSNLTWSC